MYFPDRDYIDHFKDIISSVNRCMTIGNGINKGGLKTSLESMFNELIQYYEEYFNFDKIFAEKMLPLYNRVKEKK